MATKKSEPQKRAKPQAKAEPSKKAEPQEGGGGFSRIFGEVANKTSQAAGRASAFMIAAGVVVVWAITGPLFQYSDTWQLVINTGTTIVTFLMVFLIQNSQTVTARRSRSSSTNSFASAPRIIPLSASNISPTTSWKTSAPNASSGRKPKGPERIR